MTAWSVDPPGQPRGALGRGPHGPRHRRQWGTRRGRVSARSWRTLESGHRLTVRRLATDRAHLGRQRRSRASGPAAPRPRGGRRRAPCTLAAYSRGCGRIVFRIGIQPCDRRPDFDPWLDLSAARTRQGPTGAGTQAKRVCVRPVASVVKDPVDSAMRATSVSRPAATPGSRRRGRRAVHCRGSWAMGHLDRSGLG